MSAAAGGGAGRRGTPPVRSWGLRVSGLRREPGGGQGKLRGGGREGTVWGAADGPWDEGRPGSGCPGEGRNGSGATPGKLERRGLGPPSAFMPELPLPWAVQVPLLQKKKIKKREGRHGLNEARAGGALTVPSGGG